MKFLLYHSRSKTDDGKYLSNFAKMEKEVYIEIDEEKYKRDVLKEKKFESIEQAFQGYKLAISGCSESVIDDLINTEDGKEVKKKGGKGFFKKLKLELDISNWSRESDDFMRYLVRKRLMVDERYKEIIGEAINNGVKLYHFDRSGGKSKHGGFFEKTTGKWVGGNMLSKFMEEEYVKLYGKSDLM